MKDIIEKIIKPKKVKEKAADEATEAMVESLKSEAKKDNPWPKPLHHPSCTCFKCERWKAAENA